MKKNGPITAFYLETLLLIVVFIGIILVLTQVFGLSRTQSREARRLTDAVILAQNGAEAVLVSWDDEGDGFVRNQINVFYGAERNPLYTLETAAFHGEVGA